MAAIDISVITPAYNCMAYLPDCVESVARQEGVAVEHIIVDDGSTDETARIMGELRSVHPHVQDHRLGANIGQARARNHALGRARGRYVIFLDSDDMLEGTEGLRELLHCAEHNDADLVHFQYNRTTENALRVTPADNALTGERQTGVDLRGYPRILNATSCWQMFYRRAFLSDENLLFSHRLRQREDRPFLLECLLKARRINVTQTRAMRYRVRSGSTMRRLDLEQLALFNIHLEIVDGLMRGLGDSPDADMIRRANLVYYMHVTLNYWSPFLLRSDVRDSAEADGFVAAFSGAGWRSAELFADRIMQGVSQRHRDTGAFDLMAHLLATGQTAEALAYARNPQMSPDRVERLAMSYAERQKGAPFQLTPDAMAQIAANASLAPLPKSSPRANRPKPNLILHAGATKTGSSALQKFLDINRFRLLHDHGLYYPITGLENGRGARALRTSGHATLLSVLLQDDGDMLEALDEELDQLTKVPRTVILSVENVLSARFWEAGNVTGRLGRWFTAERFAETTLVAFLRAPVAWLESMYAECVSSPGLRLTETPESFLAAQEAQNLLDFDAIGRAFQGGMPHARLAFRSYDTLRARGIDTVTAFFEAAGLKEIDLRPYHRPGTRFSNPSPSKAAIRIMRSMNALAMDRDAAADLAEAIGEIAAEIDTGSACFFHDGLADDVRARHTRTAEAFLHHHHQGFKPAHLKSRARRSDIEARALPLSGADLDRIGAALARAVRPADAQKERRIDPPRETDARTTELFRAWAAERRVAASTDPALAETLEAGEAILGSGLFDAIYYLEQAPDALDHPGGPIGHYLDTARDLLIDPHPNFSTRDYLMINVDVAQSDINPFYHYVSFGRAEGRKFIDT